MKTLVLCAVSIERREYMSERQPKVEDTLKQVWVGPGETAAGLIEAHYRRLSDPYGTHYHVSVEEIEVIGEPT